jgi:hypothetical protein
MNDKVKAMYADGYNVNQIAAIFMISQAEVNAILDGDLVVEKTGTKGKSKPTIENTPLFEDEPGV